VSEGFAVDPMALKTHAEKVTAYAGHMRTAGKAAQPLGTDAYGLIGQVFAGAAVAGAQRTSAVVGRLSDTAGEYSRDLYACLADYLLVDAEIADVLAGQG
jgi:hypothetical protein